jgi:hypothetical protein
LESAYVVAMSCIAVGIKHYEGIRPDFSRNFP